MVSEGEMIDSSGCSTREYDAELLKSSSKNPASDQI